MSMFPSRRRRRSLTFALALTGACAILGMAAPATSAAPVADASLARDHPGVCRPAAVALSFSDTLDKLTIGGATVGGLSDVAYDPRTKSYVSSVDNHLTDPSRLWFYRNLHSPKVSRAPLVLSKPDGTPYTGLTADNEGLAVLPDGDFLVSSETEPSIRIFGRDGIQKSSLRVPARFDVAPVGQSTANATLEGLTISPDGRQIIAAMEGTLSGDIPADGSPAGYRRFLVYDRNSHGGYVLHKQIGYHVNPGNRISEVQLYANGKLLVMEAAYDPTSGNSIELYASTGVEKAPDISATKNLSTTPRKVMSKQLIANVTACPTLGATAKQPQKNPLMDNYEGMTTRPLAIPHIYAVSLISDDNFGATQITRVLSLVALLP
jgi:hypothetical protein